MQRLVHNDARDDSLHEEIDHENKPNHTKSNYANSTTVKRLRRRRNRRASLSTAKGADSVQPEFERELDSIDSFGRCEASNHLHEGSVEQSLLSTNLRDDIQNVDEGTGNFLLNGVSSGEIESQSPSIRTDVNQDRNPPSASSRKNLKSASNGNTSIEDSDTEQPSQGILNTNWLRVYESRRPKKNQTRRQQQPRSPFQSFPQWYTGKHAEDVRRREEKFQLFQTHGVEISYEEDNYSPEGQMIQVNEKDDPNKFNSPLPAAESPLDLLRRASGLLTTQQKIPPSDSDVEEKVNYDLYDSAKAREKIGASETSAFQQSPLRTHLLSLNKKVTTPSIGVPEKAVYPNYSAIYQDQQAAVSMDEQSTSLLNSFKFKNARNLL